jgi:hypothetical protein
MAVTHTITGGLVHLSGNPIYITLTASSARFNHRLALKVTRTTLQGVELMGSPSVEEIAPKNLVSVFDISGLVDYPAEYKFDYPATGAARPYDLLACRVTIDIGEVWTDTNGKRQESWQNIASNHQLRVIKGKLRQYELSVLNESGKSFASEYINGGKFLTHLPNFQKVGPNHIPRLWYLSRWTSNHNITAHLKFQTTNKVAHMPITQDFVLYDITGLVEFAFSPRHWDYYLDSLEQIESYEFWLTDSGGDISERRTFLVDNGYYEESFTLYYVNPFSGIDMIWLTGQHSAGIKIESETAYRPVSAGSGTKVASLKTISATSQRTWEINTGVKTRAEMDALRDFLEAKECWLVDPQNVNRLIPVVVENGDKTLYDSAEDIHHLSIKLQEAHR